jgi:2',3'-cyclic-nucleotide 2'-phosphodiesterase (5'-nucleotidase family)
VLGGLARRVAFVEKEKASGKTALVVDSGDLFFDGRIREKSHPDLAKARIISRAYRKMGAIALNVGDLDLLHGVEFLVQLANEGLPLISANLVNAKDSSTLFPPFRIHEAVGLRFGFLGLLPPSRSSASFGPSRSDQNFIIQNPLEALREILPRIRSQADLVILLSDLGLQHDHQIAQTISGLDFILGGHEGRWMDQPTRQGQTFILQSGYKGMYAGRLNLQIQDPSRPFQDLGRPDQIRREIQTTDRQIRYLQQDKRRSPTEEFQRNLEYLNGRKSSLLKELEQVQASLGQGNRFLWTLQALDPSIPEDPEVLAWILEAGIQKDEK